ncbi:MAG TPA: hypothetical protein DDW84_08265 [Phycisphaerales bacterium]|nr:MAG: hypothetical protein A2Y13_07330 [Planctomycetes bacterium GWC2_45_44]HBG78817.1 hypothetical protein [Phycisphaerales bacterium]HBR20303.1 hypothetical protein [Phycisphaerales bacterium]
MKNYGIADGDEFLQRKIKTYGNSCAQVFGQMRKFFANFVKFLQKIESFDADFADFHRFFVVFYQFWWVFEKNRNAVISRNGRRHGGSVIGYQE